MVVEEPVLEEGIPIRGRALRPAELRQRCSMRYFGVRTTAVATQGSGMAAAATELSRTASATVFTEW